MTVDSSLISSIGKGVLVFAAVDRDDGAKEVESMAAKVLKMKMWPDESGGVVLSGRSLGSQLVWLKSTVEIQRTGNQWRGALWCVDRV